MPSLATTPGNTLVMPRSSTAGMPFEPSMPYWSRRAFSSPASSISGTVMDPSMMPCLADSTSACTSAGMLSLSSSVMPPLSRSR